MSEVRYCQCKPGCDIPYGYCHCLCGGRPEIATMTQKACGWVKGEPKRYVFNHHRRKRADMYYEIRDLGYMTPCWFWTGNTRDGYGRINREGRYWNSHVWYYIQAKGPVPDGLQVDHLCHDSALCAGGSDCPHRRCVNPDHLEPKTQAENVQRSAKSRPKKTHCRHGHAMTPENTLMGSDGGRRCRTCQNAGMLRYYYRTRAAKPKPDRP